jgi:hypothetical protein
VGRKPTEEARNERLRGAAKRYTDLFNQKLKEALEKKQNENTDNGGISITTGNQ